MAKVGSFLVPRIRLTPNTNIKSYFHRACQSVVPSLGLLPAAHVLSCTRHSVTHTRIVLACVAAEMS
ncbi:hypothetical protein E2C01_024558 [Portunus trituberculatus]|uniref:Uncharacterized protein n=1 Tax=Portunus trituberculatus TaxID=210409 RepID=A0A5B7EE43_PORTR|nr:hypothetical protein [Portunus trituberculatus]